MAYASLMGVRVKRKEDPRLITGIATYVGDMTLPGMRHVAFVRSPYAHARIRGLDAARGLSHPGVLAVVTGPDIAALSEPMPMASAGEGASSSSADHKQHSRYALSVDRV
ncbi:MAG TPA: xanthine dehydrogenase family protein molybdopterin-binding subunit, partial [Roseiflexaceae bacterium]